MTSGLQPPDSTCATERVYQLGHVVFSLRNCDQRYKEAIENLLPHFKRDLLTPDLVQEINTGCTKEVLDLIRHIANLHHKQNCIWIEASCLLSPTGQKVLLAGRTQTGKSTTTIALGLKHKWRILAENLCIIDYGLNRIVQFSSPASFDDEALQLLRRNEVVPQPTFALEWRKNRVWSPLKNLTAEGVHHPDFDLAVWLERPDQSVQDLTVDEISANEFARKVLSISNLLKIKGSYDCFSESLASARCLCLTGGELDQRLKLITEAMTGNTNA